MPTARMLIGDAHRLLGLVDSGNALPEAAYQDNLRALNQMLESWSIERLAVYNTQDQVFTWPAGELTRTLGPTGNFIGSRPVLLDDSTYYRDPATGISFGVKQLNQQQYNGIAVKTVSSTYPQVMWVNMDNPNIAITVYPQPTRELEWHFVSVQELAQSAELSTELVFPPGYLRAFKYNLATELAAEFNIEPTPQVQRIAMISKRSIKRVNAPGDLMSMPYALVATGQRFNVYAGS